jgi:hypothetical protein
LSKTERRRRTRVKSGAESPLDDGPRLGPEFWREIDGVWFCHWDRWLLRLALTEPLGLVSIAQEFHRRAQNDERPDRTAEALVAQVADLQTRLDELGRTPESILDEQERTSEWLRAKAFRRVWHASGPRKTEAMRRTPRAVLEERAMRGNWGVFAVSPRPYAEKLEATVGQDCQDWRGTAVVVTLLDVTARELLVGARTFAERLAIHRAVLAIAIEAMERIDDSLSEMAELFREYQAAYLTLILSDADHPGLLRDLVELVVWEDYGLFAGIPGFFRRLAEPTADSVMRELGRTVCELRAAGLRYQLVKAQRLRRELIAAAVETFLCEPDRDGPAQG